MTGITLTDQSGTVSSPAWASVYHGTPSPDCGWTNIGTSTSATLENNSLAVFISGDNPVNTGNNCEYSANGYGGYLGYTFSWSTDGTIVSGQHAADLTVSFQNDGSHFVYVTVTDAQSQQATRNFAVTSESSDPPELTCAVM